MPYSPVFSDFAADFLIALPKSRQRRLLQRARELASHPFFTSDYVEKDATGRTIEHLVIEDVVFAYWVDHASRTVFITEISDAG